MENTERNTQFNLFVVQSFFEDTSNSPPFSSLYLTMSCVSGAPAVCASRRAVAFAPLVPTSSKRETLTLRLMTLPSRWSPWSSGADLPDRFSQRYITSATSSGLCKDAACARKRRQVGVRDAGTDIYFIN